MAAPDGYRIVHHVGVDGQGLPSVNLAEYDVFRNPDNERMNDKPLGVRAAERLLARLVSSDKGKPKAIPEEVRATMSNQKIKWRKIGGGSFRTKSGRIIKQNQVFDASVDEIPLAFRDVIIPIEPIPEELPLDVVPVAYTIVSKGPGWYNVLDPQGKVVNEKALRQPEAKALVERLMG